MHIVYLAALDIYLNSRRHTFLPPPRSICTRRCLSLCLFVCLLATLRKTSEWIYMKFSGKVGNGPVNKWLNFGGDPGHHLGKGIVFRIRHYWELWKVVSTDCAARRCSAMYALAGIAIAPMTSLVHRPTTGSYDSRALADVCNVPVLLHCVSKKFPPLTVRNFVKS